jgi:uncharacterized protein YraI
VALVVAVLSGCGATERFEDIGAPFSYDNRPLAERMADREAELATERTTDDPVPAAFAFADQVDGIEENGPIPEPPEAPDLLMPTSPVGVILRGGPGREHREVLRIPTDAVVATTGNEIGEWTHVDYGDSSGWVPLTLMAIAPDGATVTLGSEPAEATSRGMLRVVGKTDGAGLNMRVSPDLESNIVALLPGGAEVEQIGSPDGPWVQVSHNGFVGWAWAAYMEPVN